ncbi:hypothetical protein H2248_004502 [Termitomyces sp. 'cryptogamus']|nr:hypothetical protein H2248_004502 [Termitomyces sp. 'cryptogamus']
MNPLTFSRASRVCTCQAMRSHHIRHVLIFRGLELECVNYVRYRQVPVIDYPVLGRSLLSVRWSCFGEMLKDGDLLISFVTKIITLTHPQPDNLDCGTL